jgi:parallel beta-helix repeat protein
MRHDVVRRLRLLVFLTLGLAWIGPGWAVIRYAAPGGSGGSDCTAGTNITTPLSSVNNGLACLGGAGDVLYLRGGTYNEVIPHNSVPSGSSWSNQAPGGSVVWIGAYSPSPGTWEAVTIQGDSHNGTLEMWGAGAPASGPNYIIWDHLHIHGTNSQSTTISGGDQTVIFQNGEVTLSSDPPCTIPYTEQNGILVIVLDHPGSTVAPGITFRNNYMHNNPCSYAFYIQGTSVGLTIEGNTLANNAGYSLQTYVDLQGHPERRFNNVVIRNNVIYGHGYGINPETGHMNNQCAMSVGSCTNCFVYNNVMYDNRCGMAVARQSDNVKVYNNTFYNTNINDLAAPLIEVASNTTNTTVRNNLAYQSGTNFVNGEGGGAPGSNVQSNNVVDVDPQFANAGARDLHLSASTPTSIRDGGVCLSEVPTDRDGNARPNSGSSLCDVGAYEYGGTVANIPTPTNLHFTTLP